MFFKYRIYWKLDVGANIQLAALDVSASFPVSVCMATHHIVNVGILPQFRSQATLFSLLKLYTL